MTKVYSVHARVNFGPKYTPLLLSLNINVTILYSLTHSLTHSLRKLVFTHENVLVHQLGEGQKAFVRKGKKPTGHSTAVPTATTNPLLLLCKDASHVYDHLAEENACRSNSEAQNPNAPATVADAPPKEKECLSCVGGGGGAVDLLSLSSAPTVCSSLFIEPMEWMGELSETAGKVSDKLCVCVLFVCLFFVFFKKHIFLC